MEVGEMATALRRAGWTVVPPASAPIPALAVGQIWMPTKPGRTALQRMVAKVWSVHGEEVITYALWDDEISTVTLPTWQSWVRKHHARPVMA